MYSNKEIHLASQCQIIFQPRLKMCDGQRWPRALEKTRRPSASLPRHDLFAIFVLALLLETQGERERVREGRLVPPGGWVKARPEK